MHAAGLLSIGDKSFAAHIRITGPMPCYVQVDISRTGVVSFMMVAEEEGADGND